MHNSGLYDLWIHDNHWQRREFQQWQWLWCDTTWKSKTRIWSWRSLQLQQDDDDNDDDNTAAATCNTHTIQQLPAKSNYDIPAAVLKRGSFILTCTWEEDRDTGGEGMFPLCQQRWMISCTDYNMLLDGGFMRRSWRCCLDSGWTLYVTKTTRVWRINTFLAIDDEASSSRGVI